MAKFTVKPKNAVSAIDVESDIASELIGLGDAISNIGGSLGFQLDSEAYYNVQNRIKNAVNMIDCYSKSISDMSSALQNILDAYERTENMLLGSGNVIENGIVSPAAATVADDKGEMSYEDAITILKDIGASVPIVKAILNAIEKLKAASVFLDIASLAITMATDVLHYYNKDISRNAMVADLLVDAALFLVKEGAKWAGAAIGAAVTAEAGGAGGIIGKAVGGAVGAGISTAMNFDWNGDKEGGVGKDALTDWIDSMLDKVWEDEEFAGEI